MKVYKATAKDMKCHGLQYEIGKTVEAEGELKLCDNGLHACECPLDLFTYYPPGNGSRYFEAEAEDLGDERVADSKVVAKKLTLGVEIGIPELVKAHIEYVKAHTTSEHTDPRQATAGSYGAATAGDNGAATAGSYGAATAGFRGAATAGDNGAATAGFRGAATAGFRGAATAGSYGAATAGDNGAATAGSYGAATSRGCSSCGKNGMSVCRGNNVKAKGGLGALLVIAIENDDDYNIREWKAVVVDGNTVKADTWYTLKDGEFVEVHDE